MSKFIARISDDRISREQSVITHLRRTAEIARGLAAPYASELAEQTALYRDVGKYSAEFQRHILGARTHVDHSTAGGRLFLDADKTNLYNYIAAYCVMGHHGGLPDGSRDGDNCDIPSLQGRRKKQICDFSPYETELPPPSALPPPAVRPTSALPDDSLLRERVYGGERSRELFGLLAKRSVSCYRRDFDRLNAEGKLTLIYEEIALMNDAYYDKAVGIRLDPNDTANNYVV